jgi:hypothetical protein
MDVQIDKDGGGELSFAKTENSFSSLRHVSTSPTSAFISPLI